MEKTYNFMEFESRISKLWISNNAFSPQINDQKHDETNDQTNEKPPFVIVIPPPNVTGALHMGHGLNNNIQDILARYQRMCGRPTVWVPGSDHAGIATQQVMEKRLKAEENKTRHDLGREEFIRRTSELAEQHKGIIMEQLRRIGSSCDWNYERFTLDEGLSNAVREVFVTLYERGLIYRGDYLVNWSVGAETALSDDEVEYKEVQGALYHIRYPFEHKDGGIIIATTRPETLLGDTAVAVHPDDTRHTQCVGSTLRLPLTERSIPIIADSYVDPEFGSGGLKVTPAHDPNDYEIGKRHNLACINILNTDGTLNNAVPEKYRGLSVNEARKIIVQDLEEQGYLVSTEPYTHQVGHCYRTGTVIEPMLSTQWFVKMDGMAQKALAALHDGKIRFYPKHWENTYVHWMENIRDWCISRQLWWGHRIPVWYDDNTGEMIVSRQDPTTLPEYANKTLRQDTDVLDTWFSSWLWPFSVFGWPHHTEDLQRYYPTSTLVTAYDIIFFWVARMVMAGIEFTGEVPFKDIYIHGLVRDDKGQKMSKSLGNGIDPLKIVDTYGADALKFTLAFLCKLGGDVSLNENNFQFGSRFANKIWNASRYILMNIIHIVPKPIETITLTSPDKWILHKLSVASQHVQEAVAQYRIDDATRAVYEYFWWDFCDWYIEISKISLYKREEAEQQRISSLLLWILEDNLRLLHPFLPFITEEIFQHINTLVNKPERLLTIEPYPQSSTRGDEYEKEASTFAVLQSLVSEIRTLRSEFNISPKLTIDIHVHINDESLFGYFTEYKDVFDTLTSANIEQSVFSRQESTKKGIGVMVPGCTATVFIQDSIDVDIEIARIKKKIEKITTQLERQNKQLNNPTFLEKANPTYIKEIQSQVQEYQIQITHLVAFKKNLEAM